MFIYYSCSIFQIKISKSNFQFKYFITIIYTQINIYNGNVVVKNENNSIENTITLEYIQIRITKSYVFFVRRYTKQ